MNQNSGSSHKVMTIERHLIEQQRHYPEATGEFTNLLYDLALAAKVITREVRRAGLGNIIGATGSINVQGEEVKKLDELANGVMFHLNAFTGRVAVMASEEEEDLLQIPDEFHKGNYVLIFDPLDGSSNIDVNVSVGTIFSIHRKISKIQKGSIHDCLQPGYKQVAAGYVLYGSSTMFVYTAGNGVHGFTLEPSIGEFLLSHPDIKIPSRLKYYSTNEANTPYWDPQLSQYLVDIKQYQGISSRYIGSLVADFHRNLLEGGVYLYPRDNKDPTKTEGKLRLLYEAAPLALIAREAGGYASDGEGDILELIPQAIHQRTPLFIGNYDEVKKIESLCKATAPK
ncbi:MAG: class 1 fructose-bisphosphatase [Oligoflexia bacterium]|nr:class 1 fructose-bisphosphatase [Oligoflexia bacterium]MBF0364748.1 class 1 fructose-bisphosphatase [Oligoflexia bacterium]